MSDKISVIVPIYNGEKYLARCLDSLQRQTWQNMELLLIDDGSTDGSAAICRQYAENDNRFKYHYKENGGVSSARNLGLGLITGDYVGFCDCDDWVSPTMYESLIENIKENNSNISIVEITFANGHSASAFDLKNSDEKKLDVYNQADGLVAMFNGKLIGSVCNKLFSATLIKEIRFENNLYHSEDWLFCTNAFLKSNRIVFDNRPMYAYYNNDASAVHSPFSERNWTAISECLIESQLIDKCPDNVKKWQTYHLLSMMCTTVRKAFYDHYAIKRDRLLWCKRAVCNPYYEEVKKSLYKKDRILLNLLCHSFIVLRLYMRIEPVLFSAYSKLSCSQSNM